MKSLLNGILAIASLGIVAAACTGGDYFHIPDNAELTKMVGSSINKYVAKPNDMTSTADKVKDPAARDGWFVTKLTFSDDAYNNQGPFPGLTTYSYVALKTDEWVEEARSRHMSVDEFVNDYFAGYITIPEYERDRFFVGVTPVGLDLYQDQYGHLYDAAGAAEKDLETLQVVNEDVALQASGRALSAQFGLSEEQGFRVAHLAQEWQTISKSRQMTAKDLEAFSEDLSGVKMSELRNAAKRASEGDKASVEKLINKAADNLDTTPENMKVIVDRLMGQ